MDAKSTVINLVCYICANRRAVSASTQSKVCSPHATTLLMQITTDLTPAQGYHHSFLHEKDATINTSNRLHHLTAICAMFSKHNQMYHFNSSLITVLCVSFQELRSDSWKCSYCTHGKKEGHQTFGLESCKWLKWNLCINWKLQSSIEKTKCSDPRVVLEVNKLLLMER